MVKENYGEILLAYCDFRKLPGEIGFQRTFGTPGTLKPFVAFDVSLGDSFYDDFRYLNFSRSFVNEGNHFNLRDGYFTVPFSGIYLLTVHGQPIEGRPFRIQIHVNGKPLAEIANGNHAAGQSLIRELAKGDRVSIFNFGGDIYEDPSISSFHFIGVILQVKGR